MKFLEISEKVVNFQQSDNVYLLMLDLSVILIILTIIVIVIVKKNKKN